MENKMRVGVVTMDFGFGPVSKSAYIIEAIQKHIPNTNIRFFGNKNSLLYIKESDYDITVYANLIVVQ